MSWNFAAFNCSSVNHLALTLTYMNQTFVINAGHLSAATGGQYHVPLCRVRPRLRCHGDASLLPVYICQFEKMTWISNCTDIRTIRLKSFPHLQMVYSYHATDDEHLMQVAPPFASGIVFLSAMLDRLTVQCFYNRDLLTILQARSVSRGKYS